MSGLTTAVCLRRAGLDVTLVAEKFAPHITSAVAGALWEWPPAICPQPQDELSLARAKKWSKTSYDLFAELARSSETGVQMRRSNSYFLHQLEEGEQEFRKMRELKDHVHGFIHDPALIVRNGIQLPGEQGDAYSILAPIVDTDTYLKWLLDQLLKAGGRVIERKVSGSLREREGELKRHFSVSAIVNCSGLGAAELANDELYSLRGALIRVLNNGTRFPSVTEAHCLAPDPKAPTSGFIFIVPRSNDVLVMGGFAEPGQRSLAIGLDNYEPIRLIYERCLNFLPVLKPAELDSAEPVRVGLRPFRQQTVRLEREAGTAIVHNYGHGGAGVTLSWGCALEAVQKVQALLGIDDHPIERE